jgi:nickel-type superoxide dismutase maturation protease
LLAAAVVLASGWATGRLRRVEVVGESMRPTLEPGDRLFLARTRRVRAGDLVAVRDPRHPGRTVVKRVAAVSPAGLTVLGDNPPASTDSRSFGTVAAHALRGRVVYRYHPAPRRGRPR